MPLEVKNPIEARRKRPILVWLITIFCMLPFAVTSFSLYVLFSGVLTLKPEDRAYLEAMSNIDWFVSGLIGILLLLFAISLFFLRKVSFYIFTGYFLITIAETLHSAISKGLLEVHGGPGILGTGFSLLIDIAIMMYVWNLRKSGILR